jgi:stage II sporulation protein AA (anti-sigma F factor antagonist)
MFECKEVKEHGFTWLCFEGRIDALSVTEIDKLLNALILEGERVIGADFEKVNYISSAGLRAFMSAQKQLNKVGGEIVLAAVPSSIFDIFSMTGFHNLFRFEKTRQAAGARMEDSAGISDGASAEVDGIAIRYMEQPAGTGSLTVFGDHKKMDLAGYHEEDVVRLPAGHMAYGAGLGALGDEYDLYRELFGEAMIINGNFFFYPAVRNPAVDFMICSREEEGPSLSYNFFHGFGFNGGFRYILSFEGKEEWISLSRLAHSLFELSSAHILGIVFLAESKGVWGMHLKNVPIVDNRPKNGKGIFDSDNFSHWFSFPLEPGDINHVVVGTGVAVRPGHTMPPRVQEIMAEETRFHFHGGIYSKGPIGREVRRFEQELDRVVHDLNIYKVQHLLGKTCFSSGMVGVIELDASD